MKSIIVSKKTHSWIMDNKNHNLQSADAVIWGLIQKNIVQEEKINELISMLPK